MKLSKKLLTALVTASLVVGTSVTAFAASNSDVITALTNAGVSSDYISQVQTYLNNNTISSSNLDAIVTEIGVVKAAGVKSVDDYNKLDSTTKAQVAAAIKTAATDAGLTVTKNSDGSFVAKDASGNTVATISSTGALTVANASGTTGAAANTTGTNYGNLAALGALLVIVSASTLVVSKRRQAVANN
ncbi:MAG: hypothetical protein Q8936_04085 [Bacillota bacterium]|nr:hypothetical protein [Bacillota bacterium]